MVWIFIAAINIFKSFGFTKICNNLKWTKTSRNEVMQPTTSNKDSWPIFPDHVHNQTIPSLAALFTRAFRTWVSVFKFTRVQGSTSIKAARKVIFDYQPIIVGSWKPRFKILEFKCLSNQGDVPPKQRYDKFPSARDQIHATPSFEYAWATPRHTAIRDS